MRTQLESRLLTVSLEASRVAATVSEWEQAEIDRSEFEAAHTPPERLIASEPNVARYMNPPRDTAYPLEYAFALLGDICGKTVLDFGCGSGENSLLLARRGARVVGLDISRALLSLASRRLALNGLGDCAEFVVGSAHKLPLPDASVDAVVGIAILHHVDLKEAASEIHRVLKPGGRAIFQEPVRDSAAVRVLRKMIPYRSPDVSPFERPLTTRELREFARRFTIRAWRAFALPFVSVTWAVPALRRYIHQAYEVDKRLLGAMTWLSRFGSIRVIAIDKST
ncbi:MAG TPA: class I SAM-dependent methyltransferase [Vicinamibacterales bacterium]|nr:class I SAM-dependent methyltransferase [Vicinamibacterales bacterium]